ncbi:uncharacterized protein METZ01_LOCUS190972 [marine metagenome]|uniref:Uncharacterized protein n=1 Tax=marine metagenome TaxID=408172 RepID=A0A382DIA8_9ZZZZ
MVATIPNAIDVSNPHPRLRRNGRIKKSSIDGITSHSMLSAKSATCAVSSVSLYSHVIDIMLARGSEMTSAPNTADLFAISLAVTITAPEKRPLPARLTQSMVPEAGASTQSCRYIIFDLLKTGIGFIL